ncbi:flagellar hook-basal body complex protein [Pseudokineococcus marinus]|uniref:Flagellar hook protein FlgE n=1 Tax=Pseudokineococcus marinus TaxID=351215 RepID=A0A849BQV9_9ACTN|nr:flagellar hook-basal body complex protein [Pseudokineococcus marinus]NNH23763.1 flagellar hook-basal body complex protein [Pseudokineococcus marinus]
MLRSLFTGISGLRAHQMMMDVTGNNIANVNTNGFKGSAITFQDTYSQMIEGASAPQAGPPDRGGVNPSQVGLGVRVAGMTTNFTQGATQSTGRATDVMLDGNGFFVVDSGGEQLYSRAGSFDFDRDGTFVNSEGAKVQGWQASNTGVFGPQDAASMGDINLNDSAPLQPAGAPAGTPAEQALMGYRIGSDGVITGVYRAYDGQVTQQAVARIAVATFANNGSLEKAGSSLYRESVNSGNVVIDPPGQGAAGTMSTGALEMSNVDLAQEFTNLIISQRGFQANSRVITSSDELLQDLVNLKR